MKNYEYIPYSDRIIFQYGGGAFGKQYFTKEEREEFLSEHQPWKERKINESMKQSI